MYVNLYKSLKKTLHHVLIFLTSIDQISETGNMTRTETNLRTSGLDY